jgi:hypothetical protein
MLDYWLRSKLANKAGGSSDRASRCGTGPPREDPLAAGPPRGARERLPVVAADDEALPAELGIGIIDRPGRRAAC